MIFIENIEKLSEIEKQQIFDLLVECDKDFLPPLSSRMSSTDSSFVELQHPLPIQYFESIIQQDFIIAKTENKIVGFLSYIHQYSNPSLPQTASSNYVTTTCISPKFRGKGISKQLNAWQSEVFRHAKSNL